MAAHLHAHLHKSLVPALLLCSLLHASSGYCQPVAGVETSLPAFAQAHTRLVLEGRITRRMASTDAAGVGRVSGPDLAGSAFSRYESVESRLQQSGAHFVYAVALGSREVLVGWPEFLDIGACVGVFTSRSEPPSSHYSYGHASLSASRACR
jgi:hypothetical protein